MSSKTIPAKFVLRALEMDGYLPKRGEGNHVIYAGRHGGNLIVLRNTGDTPTIQIRWILETAGIPRARFLANVAKAKQEPRRRYTLLGTIFAKPAETLEKKQEPEIPIPPRKK